MDPNLTLAQLREAIDTGDVDLTRELFDALDTWLQRGGFVPVPWMPSRVPALD